MLTMKFSHLENQREQQVKNYEDKIMQLDGEI